MEIAGLSGTVVLETLRLFRRELPVVCLTAAAPVTVTAASGNCLPKPLNAADLRGQLEDALAGSGNAVAGGSSGVAPEAIARARASFAVSGNLLEAARELARGMPGEPASGW